MKTAKTAKSAKPAATAKTAQLTLGLPRPPAKARRGRPPKPDAGVSHLARPKLAARYPVHVTLRMRDHVYNLRAWRCYRVLRRALIIGSNRFGMRIAHFSVQGNHVHLIVEALDRRALSRGVQGLAIRMAKGLNRVMEKHGKVFADRFHSRILRTPTETRRAVHYVLFNRQRHVAAWRERDARRLGRRGSRKLAALIVSGSVDERCSLEDREVAVEPRTWLLRRALPRGDAGDAVTR